MARPKKEIDATQVERMARIGCTIEEIANVVGASRDTIERRFAADVAKGKNTMKRSLRRWQLKQARAGNPTMLIWLGKQYLDQADKAEAKTDGTLKVEIRHVNKPRYDE